MEMKYKRLNFDRGLLSNLPLQISLYFNIFYFPFWIIALIVMLSIKYSYLDYLYKIILVSILIAMVVIEVTRLYLGYVGNLTEKVPELAGFWLLSLLIQLPLLSFLLFNEAAIILPMERTVNILQMIFLLTQLGFGYGAIKSMAREQATKFHLRNFNQWIISSPVEDLQPVIVPFSDTEVRSMQSIVT